MSTTDRPRSGGSDGPGRSVADEPKRARRHSGLGGLVVRREAWVLTWRGWAAGMGLLIAGIVLGFRAAYPFLAVTDPTRGKVVIVEGWLPAHAAREAAAFCQHGQYQLVISTGGVVPEQWDDSPRATYADWGAAKLERAGVAREVIRRVPCWETRRDRTYHSALAVKKWLADNGIAPASVDVVSYGPHARRSRLLYQKAFGRSARVGVAAMNPDGYEGRYWWRNSEGARDTLAETFAYLYARFLFSSVN